MVQFVCPDLPPRGGGEQSRAFSLGQAIVAEFEQGLVVAVH
ncbi:hypothetical protein [Actinophytocola glycyrrhizae]|uniref:Uncharacterized protein n=1 Tax=Actinophytocola glycyrrhizae TaxID=2044873 RepID=A0ABV9SBT3_9PSEU